MPFVPDMLNNIWKKGAEFAERLLHQLLVPAARGKILFIGLGAVLLILVICLVAVISGPAKGVNTLSDDLQLLRIPPEDIFLPDEPDFLPGVIPGRERRDSWTAEDAEPFWYSPLENGEEQWRDRIESAIDDLLEHVP
ncbi:hypothetical protein AGMMS49579_16790 [Spirochaetia bacterium]|nr:hypothetical protein AGMMS49579_16790 [Spirochaetia bacterium]